MYKKLKYAALALPGLLAAETITAKPETTCYVCSNTSENNSYFLNVDYLYWYAKQEGNSYAATGAAITVPGTLDPNTGLTPTALSTPGKIYSPKGKMQSGFKVGAGIEFSYDRWNLNAEYTYLRSKTSSSVSSKDLNTGILPLFSYTPNNSILSLTTYNTNLGAQGYVAKASSYWSLSYNLLTLELSRQLLCSEKTSLIPHFGLAGTQQTQHFNAYYDVNSLEELTSTIGSNSVYFLQKMYGIGPRFGLDGTWKFAKHFGTFIETGCSLLWSYFRANASSYDTNTINDYSNVMIGNQTYKPHTLVPMCQMIIGLEGDYSYCGRYALNVRAGWESQFWFFQNQHAATIPNTSLLLQGLTLAFKLSF